MTARLQRKLTTGAQWACAPKQAYTDTTPWVDMMNQSQHYQ